MGRQFLQHPQQKKPLWIPEKMICPYILERNATEAGHNFWHMRLFKTAGGTGGKAQVLRMVFSLSEQQKSGAELRK